MLSIPLVVSLLSAFEHDLGLASAEPGLIVLRKDWTVPVTSIKSISALPNFESEVQSDTIYHLLRNKVEYE